MPATPHDAAARIGAAVRNMRKEYRLTQLQLSEMAGISDRTLREIEKGSGSPSLGAVLAVTNVLGISLEAS